MGDVFNKKGMFNTIEQCIKVEQNGERKLTANGFYKWNWRKISGMKG